MVRPALSSVTLNTLLGFVTYLLDDASSKMVQAPAIDSTRPDGWVVETPSHTLLELPAEIAAHGYDCYDLTILHLPSINRSYLAEVRAAFEESNVEIFQLLIDTGEDWQSGSRKKAERRHQTHQVLDRGRGASWERAACVMYPATASPLLRPYACHVLQPSESSTTLLVGNWAETGHRKL